MSKKKIFRAGLIPYIMEDGEPLMLFMKPSKEKYGGATFQIAKGKMEDGESEMETAIRESSEELGMFEGNIKGPVTELGTFLGRTTIFIAEMEVKDMFGLPDHETSETAWMTLEEFQAEGRDLHRPIIKAAVRKIKKLHE